MIRCREGNPARAAGVPHGSRADRVRALRAWAIAAVLGACLAWPGTVPASPRAHAHAPPPTPQAVQSAFAARVDALLHRAGLNPDRIGLLLYSTREHHYLVQRHIHRPMIAASNTKLVTAFAALRVLSPNYRWRTHFGRVEEHDAAGGAPRQALVVRAGADPTLTSADLRRVAWMLRSGGLRRVAGIYLDGSLFDDVKFPPSWGDVSRGQPWFAPVSPFIVDHNVVQFLIASRPGGTGFDIYSPTRGSRLVSALQTSAGEPPAIRVEQRWSPERATFTFQGALSPAAKPYAFSAAVQRPRLRFYQQLRTALRQAGVQGALALRSGPPPGPVSALYTEVSPPLRDVLIDVEKNSSNLGAEVLLRTLGLADKPRDVSGADGLVVLRRVMAKAFPESSKELHLVDGSGLSRQDRVSPLLLVRLLNRVRQDFSLRPEFVNSLSVSLIDGTLQFRNYPWRLRGRIRAKTGTLASVSNLSGYLKLRHDVIVFSFLDHDPEHTNQALQDAQDYVMTGLYDALLAREAGKLPPPVPPPVRPPAPNPPPLPPTAGASQPATAQAGTPSHTAVDPAPAVQRRAGR